MMLFSAPVFCSINVLAATVPAVVAPVEVTLPAPRTTLTRASDLAFSDPANAIKPPAYAVGQACRDPEFDALPGFKSPPPGFGAVPFFWWMGDPLTKERLSWILDELADHSISGLQINYCHGIKETLDSDPPIYSEEWWKLFEWFAGECKRRGMATCLSDYTKAGRAMDKVLADHPDMRGYVLVQDERKAHAGPVKYDVGSDLVSVTAYQMNGDSVQAGSGVDLRSFVKEGKLNWTAPAGRWSVWSARASRGGRDAMNPGFGAAYADEFFGQFERHLPGEGGKGLNFVFSDELGFGISGTIWTAKFAGEFQKRKGYDIVPELAALWTNIGPRTPKIRMDYSDVMVALSEEGFFKPVFDWHQSRGMIYGCDHGGRGKKVDEFGDYFRTQRWNQGPGADQSNLGKGLIKAKVAASIAHLYQRPRVWVEGWHSSGWGTTSAEVADALFTNYVQGYNMLGIHGLYYATHGGWWEWAPPCNGFHMPYWKQMKPLMKCAERLSYLLTQGTHVCDVAVIYPVAPMDAKLGGEEATKAAFESGNALYKKNLDFDFMDFESLDRAKIENGRLAVAGESYQALVLPAMRAIRHSTLEKAAEFAKKGGTVIAVGALPEASDRQGFDDPEVARLNRDLFGLGAAEAAAQKETKFQAQAGGGRGIFVRSQADILAALGTGFSRDFSRAAPGGEMNHRRIGQRDIYALYNQAEGECVFRAVGQVELWDPWTGEARPLPVLAQTADTTRLQLPLSKNEIQLIVFSPGKPLLAVSSDGEKHKVKIPVVGDWEFELKPSMDNRWGDYHWPATPELIGAEARIFRYAEEKTAVTARQDMPGDEKLSGWEKPSFDDKRWRQQTYSYGQQFWRLGPMPADADVAAMEKTLAAMDHVDPAVLVNVGGKEYRWMPYEFSWRFGVEGDPGYQGFHGLKERMYDEYIRLGKHGEGNNGQYRELSAEPEGSRYYLWSSVNATEAGSYKRLHGGMEPAAAWLNGAALAPSSSATDLRVGANGLLLRYDQAGSGHFTLVTPQSSQQDSVKITKSPVEAMTLGTLAMRWHGDPSVLRFDVRPGDAKPAGWYRFNSAPGLLALTVVAHGKLTAWADGVACAVTPGTKRADGAVICRVVIAAPSPKPVLVALRIEQERGLYGGAALPEPVKQECGAGIITLGDWAAVDGLRCYSGGAYYRKTISLTAEQVKGKLVLDLGNIVSTAELKINGKSAGVRSAPPWRWNVSELLNAGENRLEVLIYNTISNHYRTIPTYYNKKPTESGLLGPVTIQAIEGRAP